MRCGRRSNSSRYPECNRKTGDRGDANDSGYAIESGMTFSDQGFQVVLKMPVAGNGFRCEVVEGLASPNPVLIAIVPASKGGCETLAQQAAEAIRRELLRLSGRNTGLRAPCGGSAGGQPQSCFAHGERSCRKVLVLISDGNLIDDFSGALTFWNDAILAGDQQYVILPAAPATERKRTAGTLWGPAASANVFGWSSDPAEVVAGVLRASGIVPEDYRVFISYRQSDGQIHADCLFDGLTQLGFEVFLDRIGIQPGANISDRIEQQLAHHSFLIVLETPHAVLSSWVAQEVAFASRHRLGIFALNFPGGSLTPSIKADRRRRVQQAELDPAGALVEEALTAICARVLQRHDRWLVRRRHQMQQVLRNELLNRSVLNQRTTSSGIIEACYGDPALNLYHLWATPRVPELGDFFHLDGNAPQNPGFSAVVGPSSQPFSSEHQKILWLGKRTQIGLYDEAAAGEVAQLVAAGTGLL